jgi:hypothetical protein
MSKLADIYTKTLAFEEALQLHTEAVARARTRRDNGGYSGAGYDISGAKSFIGRDNQMIRRALSRSCKSL